MSDCILWAGPVDNRGYGRYGKRGLAHRAAYENANGSIPAGMCIHHSCEVRLCVNPEHLVMMTHGEHSRIHATRTHCRRGHEFTQENIAWRGEKRECRTCIREGKRRRYALNVEAERERSRRYYQRKKLAMG